MAAAGTRAGAALSNWIRPRLPEGSKVFLGGVPALTLASGNGKPDVDIRQWGPPPAGENVATGSGLLEPVLEARVAIRLDPQLAVHVDFHGQLIAAIELVSPRDKDRADAKERYTARYLGYLCLGVHLMLVDVLPRPKGFSFADALTSGLGLEVPPLPPPFAASYRVGESFPLAKRWGASWPSTPGPMGATTHRFYPR
jgi:hypothetical protein